MISVCTTSSSYGMRQTWNVQKDGHNSWTEKVSHRPHFQISFGPVFL